MSLPLGAPLVNPDGTITTVWLRAFFNAANASMLVSTDGQDVAATFGLFDATDPGSGQVKQRLSDLETQVAGIAEPSVSRGDLERVCDLVMLLSAPSRTVKPDPWLSSLIG